MPLLITVLVKKKIIDSTVYCIAQLNGDSFFHQTIAFVLFYYPAVKKIHLTADGPI